MANGERLEVVKGKLFCSSKVISGKLYIPQRFASGIKLWHTIVKKLPSSSVYERWQYGGEWKMEQKQPPTHLWQKQNKDWYSKLEDNRPWQKQLRRSINFRSCWSDALYSGVCPCLWVCMCVSMEAPQVVPVTAHTCLTRCFHPGPCGTQAVSLAPTLNFDT